MRRIAQLVSGRNKANAVLLVMTSLLVAPLAIADQARSSRPGTNPGAGAARKASRGHKSHKKRAGHNTHKKRAGHNTHKKRRRHKKRRSPVCVAATKRTKPRRGRRKVHTRKRIVRCTHRPTTKPVAPVSGSAGPSTTGLPTISGTPRLDQTLWANNATWTAAPPSASYAYQWQRCASSGAQCADIFDATGPSYTLTSGDLNNTIRVLVTATTSAGSASASSIPTGVVMTNAYPACTTTVTNPDAMNGAVAPGAVVCLAASTPGGSTTYSGIGVTNSGAPWNPAVVEARPGDSVTVGGISVTGNYVTVEGLHSDQGIQVGDFGAVTGVTIAHNDVTQTGNFPNCGKGIVVLGDNNSSNRATFITINGNKIHDTSPPAVGCEADAIYIQGWQEVTVTNNDIYNVLSNDWLCSNNDCHTDMLQSYNTSVSADLTVKWNYIHDNTDTQGLPFLPPADVASGVDISDNLELRMTVTSGDGIQPGMQVGINSVGMRIEHNTYWGGTHSNLTAVGSVPNPSALLDHNVFDDFQMQQNGSGDRYPNLTDRYNIFSSAPWSFSPSATDRINPNPPFMCATEGAGGSNICANGTPAGDDYRLKPNPNDIGIDWAPYQYNYGP